jgi:hypothetical protein
MTTKKTYLIPAFAAIFALMFAFASPLAMAESGDEVQTKWNGQKNHKMHKVIEVEGFVGSIQITEDADRKALRDQVSVSLSEAADGLDVIGGHIGVVTNENGDKFLVWTLKSVEKDSESEIGTVTIYVVDAANADNTTTVTKEFDRSEFIGKSNHDGERRAGNIDNLLQKFSEPTGDEEVDELGEQLVEKIGELKEAQEEGDSDKVQELRQEVKDLLQQLRELRSS